MAIDVKAKHLNAVSAACLALAAALATGPARAGETAPGSAPAGEAPAMQSQLVKTGLYMITGGGGTSLLRFSPAGLVLVNTKQPGAYKALMAQVARINKMSDLPMRVAIVTDHRPAEAGNVPQFLASGVPVIAQADSGLSDLPHPASEPPVIAFDTDYAMKTGGIEVRVLHVGQAQGMDDAVVYFPDLKVVALGDLAAAAPLPQPTGLAGQLAALDKVLTLDFDIAVPNSGARLTRAELQALRGRVQALADAAAATASR